MLKFYNYKYPFCKDLPPIIDGYEIKPMYAVSAYGDVINKYTGTELAQMTVTDGYKVVGLWTTQKYDNGEKKYGSQYRKIMRRVHRLVMYTFCPLPDYTGLQIDHIDGNKSNNNINNLEWVTSKENNNRAVNNHLKVVRLTPEDARFIGDLILDGRTKQEIYELVPNATINSVYQIATGFAWSYLFTTEEIQAMTAVYRSYEHSYIKFNKVSRDQRYIIYNYLLEHQNEIESSYSGKLFHYDAAAKAAGLVYDNKEDYRYKIVRIIYGYIKQGKQYDPYSIK